MDVRRCIVVCLTLMVALSTGVEGFDITKILGQYPEYGKFNKYLTETKLAEEINSLKAVTILALDDKAIASLSGKPEETVKAILSTHVLVDFYDGRKVVEAIGSRAELKTLFENSGHAKNKQGYVRVDLIDEGSIAFASAVEGSPFNSVEAMTHLPIEGVVSILEVTQPIVAPGIELEVASNGMAPAPSPSSSTIIHINFLAMAFAFASLFFLSF